MRTPSIHTVTGSRTTGGRRRRWTAIGSPHLAWCLVFALPSAAACPGALRATEPQDGCAADPPTATATANEEALRALEERIAELERALAQQSEITAAEELEELRAEAAAATAEEAAREDSTATEREVFVGRQRSLQALNPEISFLGDISYDWSQDDGIQDRFLVRGVEISFQSNLDPFTRFKGFLAAHQEPPALVHEGEEHEHAEAAEHEHADTIDLGIEEAYMEWLALPGNLRLRVGRFRQQLGTLNRWHPHALPSVDLPFALRNLFGHDGLAGLGVGADWQLPGLWATSNGLTVEVVNADNPSAFAGSDFGDPAFLLRHTGFFDLGPDTYLDLGLDGMIGPNDESGDHRTSILGLDFNFLWEPVERAKYHNLEIRGEVLHSRYEDGDGSKIAATSFYAYVSARLSRSWIVGLRYDDAELPWPGVELFEQLKFREGLGERAWSALLTFWQSEFVRLRLQYQHTDRDFAWHHGPESDNRIWLQATFAAGPHKHDSY